MKKLFTLTHALILAFSLAACDFSPGGDNSTGEGKPTNSTTQPNNSETPATSEPTTPNVDNALIGQWSSRRDTPFEKSNRRIEFKSDGTFLFRIFSDGVSFNANSWGFSRFNVTTLEDGTFITKGIFSIQGDKILCTNVKCSYTAITGGNRHDFTDKPGDDFSWTFIFDDIPYTVQNPSEIWKNGYVWLNIETGDPESAYSGRWASFQKPE